MESILEKRFSCPQRLAHMLSILMFLVGPYLEVGEFYSVRSRRGSTLSRAAQQKPWESKRIVESTTRSSTTKIVTPVANDTATTVTSDVKPCLGGIIDIAFEYIAAECARQREM